MRLVNFSITIIFFHFSAGDVPVVSGPGALVVPPGTVVPVGTQPGSLAKLPVDRAGLLGGPIWVAWTPVLTLILRFVTSLVGRFLAAASAVSASISLVGLDCRHFC